jgi:F-type H+-transporting ATPase subunit gamma
MRPYAEKLTELLQNLSATLEGDGRRYTTQREVKKVLVDHFKQRFVWCI